MNIDFSDMSEQEVNEIIAGATQRLEEIKLVQRAEQVKAFRESIQGLLLGGIKILYNPGYFNSDVEINDVDGFKFY